MSEKKHQVSRRQFLNYTLTGVGGFMASAALMPMVRFALDPVLKDYSGGDFVATGTKVDDITTEPVSVDFVVEQVDAWYESDEPKSAWVYKDDNGEIVALSPICQHLGCTVNWNGDSANQNMFFCPCHNGLYKKNGKNVEGTPPPSPLLKYETKVKDGILLLGKANPQNL
ncbi:ubiquinol-cytochrome c reductase iron-sulfur subunit [Bacillus carboniphilus]|uniref:Ubiquinol-cytochrome c reductase iron-sulfur subunit n=1 Tax=Bacillus carboniphilus TaxID=86663 RepID=A0ABY9JZ50_9BACI|nr:ubiquinol-cytochrome c reductase iron-sulfur subunit [Bacillus carboniphilus]WLR43725.1 ubiquinol-cytochrome c reductase iron-sulfur subunit [Bacillus carboniphilus]